MACRYTLHLDHVLANVAGKSAGQIFQEFQGHYTENQVQGSGDVKYHLGTSGVFTTDAGASTNVYLAANPSHLEAVNPVLEGIVRAKQDRMNVKNAYSVMPILMHEMHHLPVKASTLKFCS